MVCMRCVEWHLAASASEAMAGLYLGLVLDYLFPFSLCHETEGIGEEGKCVLFLLRLTIKKNLSLILEELHRTKLPLPAVHSQ